MTFKDLHLTNALWNALDDAGFQQPTTIQHASFPVVMSGRDVHGIAQTGTGKTVAYLLPLLRLWTFSKIRQPQVVIIVPTRELVAQVVEEAQLLARYMSCIVQGVYGGTNLNTQAAMVAEGADIVVGTPGRLLDLAYHGALKLKAVKKLVIDEVDEMLALGFRSQLEHLIDMLPAKRQNLLFSATITDDVELIIQEHFNNPVRVEAAPPGTPVAGIHQVIYRVPNYHTKVNLLIWLLEHHAEMTKVLVFVSTKSLADTVFTALQEKWPEHVGVIHSNKDQNYRFKAVTSFKEGTIRILVATDIIARGIDVEDVSHVVNFDVPDDPLLYIHRIGRTGRADKLGEALSLVSNIDADHWQRIVDHLGASPELIEIPQSVVISDQLTDDEMPKVQMKNVLVQVPKIHEGSAYHEKKASNKKVNRKISHKEKMMAKYGKPKTRGAKRK